MRDDYERRVRGFEMQVSKLKTRQKEWERVARDKDVAERKVVELKEEVGRLGVMIGGLKKRVKEGKELKKKEIKRSRNGLLNKIKHFVLIFILKKQKNKPTPKPVAKKNSFISKNSTKKI